MEAQSSNLINGLCRQRNGLLSDVFEPESFQEQSHTVVRRLVEHLSDSSIKGLDLIDPAVLSKAAKDLMTSERDTIAAFDEKRLSEIVDLYIRTGIQVHSPGYLGRQFSGVIPLGGVVDFVSAVVNQPSSFYEAAQLPNVAERLMADELNQFIGWDPDSFAMVTTSGGSSSVSHSVTVAQVNQPPTAAFTVACSGLACSFDGRSSTDDGSIASYAWSFGDGSTGTGATPQHTYASAGTRTVQLTVTDNAGATASTSRSVTVGTAAVAFVAAATSNASAATNRVTVPASVQAGDTLVLYFTANSTGATLTPPAGWTQLESVTGDNVLGRLWTRTATASDAGSTVTVSFSTTIKSDLTLAAYRTSGGGASTVVAHAAGLDQTLGSSHRAPAVTTTAAGQWVGTYWAAKTSSAVTWSVPGGQAVRATSTTTGGGLVSAVAVDSAGPVPQGPVAGLVGTTSIDVTRVVMFTVALGLA